MYAYASYILLFIDCGKLYAPINGLVNGESSTTVSTYEAFANFSCNTGYELSGVNQRKCGSNGVWSEAGNPNCTRLGELWSSGSAVNSLNLTIKVFTLCIQFIGLIEVCTIVCGLDI